MLKSLVKVAIFLLVANALFRFAPPYWSHNQFASDLKNRALTWRDHTDEQVMEEVLAAAQEHGVPIDREHVAIRRERDHLFVDVSYSRPLDLVPGWRYDWDYSTSVDALMLRPVVPGR